MPCATRSSLPNSGSKRTSSALGIEPGNDRGVRAASSSLALLNTNRLWHLHTGAFHPALYGLAGFLDGLDVDVALVHKTCGPRDAALLRDQPLSYAGLAGAGGGEAGLRESGTIGDAFSTATSAVRVGRR